MRQRYIMESIKKAIRISIFFGATGITFFYFYLNIYSYLKRSNIDIINDLKTYNGKLLFTSIVGRSKALEIGIKSEDHKRAKILHLIKSLPNSKENIRALQKSYLENETVAIKYDYSNLIWQIKTRNSEFAPNINLMKKWHSKTTWFTLWGAVTFFVIGCSFTYIFFRKKYIALKNAS